MQRTSCSAWWPMSLPTSGLCHCHSHVLIVVGCGYGFRREKLGCVFSGACSGTMAFFTLSVSSRWMVICGGQAEWLAAHICFPYLPPLSLSPQKMPPWAARCVGISHTSAEKFSIFPTIPGLCLYCHKAGKMEVRERTRIKDTHAPLS